MLSLSLSTTCKPPELWHKSYEGHSINIYGAAQSKVVRSFHEEELKQRYKTEEK